MSGGEAVATEADFSCLSMPQAQGLGAVQARLVDRIKRAALRRLHRSPHGERLLLRMYLAGEDATERTLLEDLLPQSPPWLERQVQQHLADERRHVTLFADALRGLGDDGSVRLEPDWLSRRKIRRWQRLAHRYAAHFEHGLLVPAYATGLCAEQMAQRVLSRHCAVIGTGHELYPLLSRVLTDEKAHVRLCENTLRRIVAPHEFVHLDLLLKDIRAVDVSFGVTGALAMYVAGWVLGGVGSAAR
ncbi:diiron oxygenase [Pseudomonas sp. B21-059]|uniref:diiron oxygenase n=1 Tax=Pseudomonas sp. B21-059 TaxID=2895496 RepID=UPI0022341C89|nr:diiron oxygenase [Pseudomonas sp. B21-059]UZE32597.1 diiron oxygenase [Pseudomonas sp. B21-059]